MLQKCPKYILNFVSIPTQNILYTKREENKNKQFLFNIHPAAFDSRECPLKTFNQTQKISPKPKMDALPTLYECSQTPRTLLPPMLVPVFPSTVKMMPPSHFSTIPT